MLCQTLNFFEVLFSTFLTTCGFSSYIFLIFYIFFKLLDERSILQLEMIDPIKKRIKLKGTKCCRMYKLNRVKKWWWSLTTLSYSYLRYYITVLIKKNKMHLDGKLYELQMHCCAFVCTNTTPVCIRPYVWELRTTARRDVRHFPFSPCYPR